MTGLKPWKIIFTDDPKPRHHGGASLQVNDMDKQIKIVIPDDMDFADLKLSRDPVTMDVSFDLSVIERICDASDIDIETFTRTHEDNLSGLIITWYAEHRQRGGAPDPVAEQLIAEVEAEDAGHNVQPSPRVQ